MSNETRTGAPLGATVGERLEEKGHEGDAQAARALDAAGGAARAGREAPERKEPRAARGASRRERAGGASRTGAGRARGWALAAGLGTWIVAGWIGRAFRR